MYELIDCFTLKNGSQIEIFSFQLTKIIETVIKVLVLTTPCLTAPPFNMRDFRLPWATVDLVVLRMDLKP